MLPDRDIEEHSEEFVMKCNATKEELSKVTASAETSMNLQGELSLENISVPKEGGNVPVSIVNDKVSIDVPQKEREGIIRRKDYNENLKINAVTVNAKEDPKKT